LTDIWGLDNDGNFITKKLKTNIFQKNTINVHQLVLDELNSIQANIEMEKQNLLLMHTDEARGRKLFRLFCLDLLPGLQGKILHSKFLRNDPKRKNVSKEIKIISSIFVFVLNFSMVYYSFLFASQKSNDIQDAWFLSFVIWIIVDIFVSSSFVVIFTHVIVPLMIYSDIEKIKDKLTENVQSYRRTLKNRNHFSNTVEPLKFNAADFLFISFKMCKLFPDLKESKMILIFSTPWPRHSYQHENKSTSKDYDKKMGVILRSFSMILLFLIGNISHSPVFIQDLLFHWSITSSIGYCILLIIKLYNFSPIIAISSVFLVGVLLHFTVHSHLWKKTRSETKINIDLPLKENVNPTIIPSKNIPFVVVSSSLASSSNTILSSVNDSSVFCSDPDSSHSSTYSDDDSDDGDDDRGSSSLSVSLSFSSFSERSDKNYQPADYSISDSVQTKSNC
jgi:hypothetical protein